MLAVDPETRPSMEAVATALNALATGGSTVAPELLAPTMPMEPATAETARLDPAPAESAPPPPPSTPPTPPADDDEDLTPRRPAPVAAAAGAAAAAPVAAAAAPVAAAGAASDAAGAASGAAGASPVRPGPPSAVRLAQRSRRNPGPLIWVAVVVIAALAAGSIWWLSGRNDPVTSGQPSTSPSVVAPETPESSATPSTSSEPTPTPSSTPTQTSVSPTPTPSDDDDDEPTAAQLAEALTSYYALVPDNRDEAWNRLTSSYQRSPSGGRQGYEAFWKPIERVSISGAKGNPPDEAEATITYVYEDGRRLRERTTFGLVEDDGILKINSSRVIGGG
jgi:hypothetical protein